MTHRAPLKKKKKEREKQKQSEREKKKRRKEKTVCYSKCPPLFFFFKLPLQGLPVLKWPTLFFFSPFRLSCLQNGSECLRISQWLSRQTFLTFLNYYCSYMFFVGPFSSFLLMMSYAPAFLMGFDRSVNATTHSFLVFLDYSPSAKTRKYLNSCFLRTLAIQSVFT